MHTSVLQGLGLVWFPGVLKPASHLLAMLHLSSSSTSIYLSV